MEYQNDKIDAFDNENNQDIINDEMSNVDIAKNIGKGAFILGKRAFEAAKTKINAVQDNKDKLADKSDDELIEIIKNNGSMNTSSMAAYQLLKERGCEGYEMRELFRNEK
ncbi:hypothetical protein [Helicobacter hepaticus]|jgi:hypothetical protein|uniref:Uncharacterized protein n=1 Tax=Helicobacter hepaticus (strain ATCC 51449 / 3B1) TaxID=235279 RepID=Q7VHQ8_HELHP|nr:hypothetical protein [Helicobacter hepaticus]AAP77502.1 hypothetical protein HH_0905 [Helicobacter hepaticus ATCC 51449]